MTIDRRQSRHLMKRFLPFLGLCAAGVLLLIWLVPQYSAPLPTSITITRDEAKKIADDAARQYGIPVDQAWSVVTWERSDMLESALADPEQRRAAASDPVLGPRLAGWRVTYFRRGQEKFPAHGYAIVTANGVLHGVRRTPRPEESFGSATTEQIRAAADGLIASTPMAGAPSPRFDSVREMTQAGRVDRTVRYRVRSNIPTPRISTLVGVYFSGSQAMGWMLLEELADGSQFQFDATSEISGAFSALLTIYVMLIVLVTIFLRKYHAGEVGVGSAAVLFGAAFILGIANTALTTAEFSLGTGFGGASAPLTALLTGAFRVLFLDGPMALLVFVGWAVAESFARERWGSRLASFDALLKRDPVNATVGTSLVQGLLASPFIAAGTLLVGWLALEFAGGRARLGDDLLILLGTGGSFVAGNVNALLNAVIAGVPVLLFFLAYFHRRRLTLVGVVLALIAGTALATMAPPIEPALIRYLFGWGGVAAAIAVFMLADILAAGVAITVGSLLLAFVPYLSIAAGDAAIPGWIGLLVLPSVAAVVGIAGLLTRREIEYSYEDLAPHVRRIVERERIKAEIDAANRIQSALLPSEEPALTGATVASHYRAASEIGGDYFDFLPLEDGRIGLAFGDVAGHGLTSGIIMAMAKSALLVQIEHDPAPPVVMSVLNGTVMKTAPRRMLMTFFYGVLDPSSQRLEFCSAGHLDPYVWRASSSRLEALSAWGFPLGVKRRDAFPAHHVEFEPGDRLILYSDGFIEAVDDDGEPFGFDRFEATIAASGHRGAADIRRALLDAVKKFTRNRPPEDDQTLVVISFEHPAASRKSA